jgi:hypothetical protein
MQEIANELHKPVKKIKTFRTVTFLKLITDKMCFPKEI